jgi:two-component system, cell cycle sensor histidine kinase and response regulator CckA
MAGQENMCVLLAEDEEIVSKISVGMLNNLGYEVIVACDGAEALEVFKREQSRIIFVVLDVVMPKKNGEDVYYAMRIIDPNVKVIFSSGFSSNTKMDLILRDEGTAFIHKPFKQADLQKRIKDILA